MLTYLHPVAGRRDIHDVVIDYVAVRRNNQHPKQHCAECMLRKMMLARRRENQYSMRRCAECMSDVSVVRAIEVSYSAKLCRSSGEKIYAFLQVKSK